MTRYDYEEYTQRDLERFRKADEYTLWHLAVHLHESGQREKLYRLLVGNKAWMETKAEKLRGDVAYVAELSMALGDFVDPLNPGEVLTLSQLCTARQVVHVRTSLYSDDNLGTLTLLGRTQEALAHARLREMGCPRFHGLMAIHQAHITSLHVTDSQDSTFDKRDAAQIKEFARAMASQQKSVAGMFAQSDQMQQAVEMLLDIPFDAEWRVSPPPAGDFPARRILEEALEAACACSDQWLRIQALWTAAEVFVQAGDLGQALEAARNMPYDALKAFILAGIAAALLRVEDNRATTQLDQTLEFIRAIEEIDIRARLQVSLIAALAQRGDDRAGALVEEVLGLIPAIADAEKQWSIRQNISLALVKIDRWQQALEAVLLIENVDRRIEALTGIAREQVLLEASQAGQRLLSDNANAEQEVIRILLDRLAVFAEAGWAKVALTNAHYILDKTPWDLRSSKAWAAYSKALEDARTMVNTRKRASALRAIARPLLWLEDDRANILLDEIVGLVQSIEEPEDRLSELRQIASLASDMNDERVLAVLNEMSEITLAVDDPNDRAKALGSVVKTMIGVGALSDALRMARLIPDAAAQAKALNAVAEAVEKTEGDYADDVLDEALKVTHTIAKDQERDHLLKSLACSWARTGRTQKALDVVHSIDKGWLQEESLGAVAKCLIDTGRINEALETGRAITDAERREDILTTIAGVMARVQDSQASAVFDEALETGRRAGTLPAEIPMMLVTALVRMKKLDGALEITRETEGDADRVKLLGNVVELLLATEDRRASALLDEALEVAFNIRNDRERSEILATLIPLLIHIGKVEEALEIVRTLEEGWLQAATLGEAAKILGQKGNERAVSIFNEALKVAGSIEMVRDRAAVLNGIANAMIDVEERRGHNVLEEAIETANAIEDDQSQALALSKIACTLSRVKDKRVDALFDRALKIVLSEDVHTMEEAALQGVRLKIIIKALAQTGRIEQALKASQAIRRAEMRRVVQGDIAYALAATTRIKQALDLLGLCRLSDFMVALGEWGLSFERIESGLSVAIQREATRIAGWVHADWQGIHSILRATQPPERIT